MAKPTLTRQSLAAMIDHAVLRPQATPAEVRAECELAARLKVASVCVRPSDVAEAAAILRGSGPAVGTVVGFPFGSNAASAKLAEVRQALTDGAGELDAVLNIGRLRGGDYKFVRDELAAIVRAAEGRIVKIILECCYLSRVEQAVACEAALRAKAHFVKTSTGFGPGGATADDVRFLRQEVGRAMGVKAAGGIRTLADALAMIDAGADRLGCSATEEILAGLA